MSQSTNHILMIRPVKFDFNPETAVNNSFQKLQDTSEEKTQGKALQEFDTLVHKLKNAGVSVFVIDDSNDPHTPDSIFPNNWISFHEDGSTLCLYPMFAQNRRFERKPHVLQEIEKKFKVMTVIDFTRYENYGKYLEGTGSMILDHENKIAYACLSPRTDKMLFQHFCTKLGFKPISFLSVDQSGSPIYHTNCMFCIADKYAVVCLDSIPDQTEREIVSKSLKGSGKLIINISYKQMNKFAGNMLQIKSSEGATILVMSSQAFESLDQEQITMIEKFDKILHSDISTIESNGGGSARCMMAEIFLQKKL